MSKKEVLVEYLSNINSIIKQSLHQTQRIKFTCFDVSNNYIVFGASSGGIYVFDRNICKFIKLIPNKEGSVTNIVISPDEKDVALSTIKGLIVVVENCFRDSNIQYQIYTEHEGNIITAMKWYLNDIYSGNHLGQISVISLTHMLTKALFQTPSATLMRLDSSIIQLDVYSKFLLVSTKSRTYLCDTLQEQYRQIGKKLRDGNFGACFFYKNSASNTNIDRSEGKVLKNLKDNGADSKPIDDIKIYCARPGSRLWEANFDSSVICTHQFRDSLNKNATSIVHLDENENSLLHVSNDSESILCNFNFERIFMFNDYILTFKADGIYIFDIKTVSLLYWTNYFSNIKDIKLLGSTVYIWLENSILKMLSLLDIESFIMKVLSHKQYSLCAQFCMQWKDDISVLIENDKLHMLKILNEKILDEKLFSNIQPLLKKVESSKIDTQKLHNGIFVVNNIHHKNNSVNITDRLLKKGSEDNEYEVSEVAVEKEPLPGINGTSVTKSDIFTENDSWSNKSALLNILNTQYQLNKINNNVDAPKFLELMQLKDLDEFKRLFDIFVEYTKNENDSKQWFASQILRFISLDITKHFKDLDFESTTFQFILEWLILLNKSDDLCTCSFPLPSASARILRYSEIGRLIMENYSNCIDICKDVPSMYQFMIKDKCEQNLIASLPLLLQYNDLVLFNKYCAEFTYDMWDDLLKYFVKLNCHICLNCDKCFQSKLNITWRDIGKFMLHSIGGQSTLKLLSRYSRYIPSGELDANFYQSCIFISCPSNIENDGKKKYSRFLQTLENNEIKNNEFDWMILNYLEREHLGNVKWNNVSSDILDSNCSVCDISLKASLFENNINLKCGHVSHKICSINKDICNSCSSNM